MNDRDARTGVARLLASLQRALSCVSTAVLIENRDRLSGARSFRLSPEPARLRGARPLNLLLLRVFDIPSIVDDPTAERIGTTEYSYELRGANGHPFLAYHWHPVGLSPVTTPHLHIGGSVTGVDLSKVHLPTGPVFLPDVLRFAIIDLGVEPLRAD